MQSSFASAADHLPPSSAANSRLIWRIGCGFLLLAVEILAISSQARHSAFSGANGFAGLLYDMGTWKIRLPITLAVIFLLGGRMRSASPLGL
jgi:hypothetical protein